MFDYQDANTIRIRDIAEVFSGFAFKSEDLKFEGIPILKIANIQDKKVIKSTVSFLPEQKYKQKLSRYKYHANDVLVAMTGEGSVGKFGKMIEVDKVYLVNQRVGILRPNINKIDPKYFYHVLTLPQYEEALYQLGLGAGQPNVSPKDIGNLYIPYHIFPTQQRIASILSSYDELIELNTQRIKLLEETARELYKEWFVRMRFPGYKNAKFVKGVPVGWNIQKVGDTFNISGGGTPSTEKQEYWNGDINWYTPTDITGASGIFLQESGKKITGKGLKESSAKLFPPYSIMMTSRATIGAVGINATPGCTNQGFITCLPNDKVPFTFLYFWILFNKEFFEMLGTGSTFLEITKGTFKKINILMPSSDFIRKFHGWVAPMFEQIEILQLQNIQLRQIRDRLLPQLISGKLAVKQNINKTLSI